MGLSKIDQESIHLEQTVLTQVRHWLLDRSLNLLQALRQTGHDCRASRELRNLWKWTWDTDCYRHGNLFWLCGHLNFPSHHYVNPYLSTLSLGDSSRLTLTWFIGWLGRKRSFEDLQSRKCAGSSYSSSVRDSKHFKVHALRIF